MPMSPGPDSEPGSWPHSWQKPAVCVLNTCDQYLQFYACECSSEHGIAPHEKQSQRKDGLCLNAWHGPPRQASRQMTGVGSTSSFYGTPWRCEALRWFRRCAHTDACNRPPRIGSGCGCHRRCAAPQAAALPGTGPARPATPPRAGR